MPSKKVCLRTYVDLLVPREQLAFRHVEALPAVVAVEHGGVVLEEHLAADGTVDHGRDLRVGRPDVLQIHVIAVCVGAERLGFEVEVHRAGERVGDDQRRGGQVVHLDVRADAAFEVAVSGQHGGDGQVVGVDRLGDLGQQRAGVADAGGAAEADAAGSRARRGRPADRRPSDSRPRPASRGPARS